MGDEAWTPGGGSGSVSTYIMLLFEVFERNHRSMVTAMTTVCRGTHTATNSLRGRSSSRVSTTCLAIHAAGYYTATTLGISVPWKKYLTQMQMIQFVAILFHSLFHLYANISAGVAANPGSHPGQVAWWMGSEVYWPTTLGYVEFFLMLNMLWMFADFYRQAYLAQKAKKAAAAGSGKPSASSVTASSTSAASSSASSSRVQPGTLASAVPAHISEDPIPGSAEPTPTNVASAAKRRVVRKDA